MLYENEHNVSLIVKSYVTSPPPLAINCYNLADTPRRGVSANVGILSQHDAENKKGNIMFGLDEND